MKIQIFVIDADCRRRATLSDALSQRSYVVPLECCSELCLCWPSDDAVVLIHHDESALNELSRLMASKGSWFPFFVYSGNPEAYMIASGFQAGALGYFEFPLDIPTVLQQMTSLLAQNEKEIRRRQNRAEARVLLRKLTPREMEVANELSSGASTKEIARTLSLSPRTVEIHRSNVIHKLSARSSADAVRLMVAAS